MHRNSNLERLHSNYLFAEVNRKKQLFQEKFPAAKIISLGVGDTSLPIPAPIVAAWKSEAEKLGTEKGYTGYEPYQGRPALCKAISERIYRGLVHPDEVFISDGAKSTLGRLQLLFPEQAVIGVQDPAYPVYVDTSVAMGHSGSYDVDRQQYNRIVYLPCTKENDFFPDLTSAPKVDVLYICAPNNPTGAAPGFESLNKLVAYALKNRSLIIYDSAYASYISDPTLPKSIYEIPGAKEVAIEVGSFTKLCGFSGVRLGWIVVPKELKYDNGKSVHSDWAHMNTVFFNGASNLAQAGGLAALSEEGWSATMDLIAYYKENAALLRAALTKKGFSCFGGFHAPYIWVETGEESWKMFDFFLEELHVVTTPGSGFGPAGQGYLRFSALGKRNDVIEAVERIGKKL